MNESLKNKYEHDLKEIKRIEGIVEQQKRWGQAHNFITAAGKQKEADRIKDGLVAPKASLKQCVCILSRDVKAATMF